MTPYFFEERKEKREMQIQREMITPEVAREMLKLMGKNRPLSELTVNRYAADMKADRWQSENGQTLVISDKGMLMDGQHRLCAVIEAGKVYEFLVVRGVAESTFDTMDNGKLRSASDILSLRDMKNATTVAAIARLTYQYAAGQGLTGGPGRVALTGFAENHPYIAEVASMLQSRRKGLGSGRQGLRFPSSSLGSVLALGNSQRIYDEEVRFFIDGVTTGIGLQNGDPRLALREWESTERIRGRGNLHLEPSFAAAARAWNAWVADRDLKVLRGLNNPNRYNLPIEGFVQSDFPDVVSKPRQRDKVIMAEKFTG